MNEYLMAKKNGREIPLQDKIFGINERAKKMSEEVGSENVVNASVGALLDEKKKLVVLDSVTSVLNSAQGEDYAPYAPIGGTDEYKEAIKKVIFDDIEVKAHVGVVATPGGTGAIRNVISNYTEREDEIITTDWYWATYKSIAEEQNRKIKTFEMLDEEGCFNIADFENKLNENLEQKNSALIILNTPAHNPTGYSIKYDEWQNIVKKITNKAEKGKQIILFVDMAYIDFAGDKKEVRQFLKLFNDLNENILVVLGYSASKTFTFYGMRTGAMVCMSKNKDIAEEFNRVCQYSARSSWSNCNRLGMWALSKIVEDERLSKKVDEEREYYREILKERGEVFDAEAKKIGLKTVPFNAGFFASIPCENPDEICGKLEKEGIFLVPLKKGIRVSVASVSKEICKELPAKIMGALKS